MSEEITAIIARAINDFVRLHSYITADSSEMNLEQHTGPLMTHIKLLNLNEKRTTTRWSRSRCSHLRLTLTEEELALHLNSFFSAFSAALNLFFSPLKIILGDFITFILKQEQLKRGRKVGRACAPPGKTITLNMQHWLNVLVTTLKVCVFINKNRHWRSGSSQESDK